MGNFDILNMIRPFNNNESYKSTLLQSSTQIKIIYISVITEFNGVIYNGLPIKARN